MQLSDWQKKGKYLNYKSHRIFTIDEGEGDALLLIHGFPTNSYDWAQMWEPLTAKYRVLTLDMIGFGFSAKPRKYKYGIFDQADLFEQFLKAKGITKVKILCHDYGDTVAQEMLARDQEVPKRNDCLSIESVCFLNGGLFPETHQPLFVQKVLMSPVGGIVSRRFNREKLAKNFKKIFGPETQPTEEELDEYWQVVSNNGGRYIFHRLIRYMKERKQNRNRWVEAIQKSKVPVRLIDGVFDPISGQNISDRYKEIIPNPDVVELQGIGHFPLIEAPDLVLKHYLEFDQ